MERTTCYRHVSLWALIFRTFAGTRRLGASVLAASVRWSNIRTRKTRVVAWWCPVWHRHPTAPLFLSTTQKRSSSARAWWSGSWPTTRTTARFVKKAVTAIFRIWPSWPAIASVAIALLSVPTVIRIWGRSSLTKWTAASPAIAACVTTKITLTAPTWACTARTTTSTSVVRKTVRWKANSPVTWSRFARLAYSPIKRTPSATTVSGICSLRQASASNVRWAVTPVRVNVTANCVVSKTVTTVPLTTTSSATAAVSAMAMWTWKTVRVSRFSAVAMTSSPSTPNRRCRVRQIFCASLRRWSVSVLRAPASKATSRCASWWARKTSTPVSPRASRNVCNWCWKCCVKAVFIPLRCAKLNPMMRCWCWVKTWRKPALAPPWRCVRRWKAKHVKWQPRRKWLTGRLRQSSTSASARSIRCLWPTLTILALTTSRRGPTARRWKIRRASVLLSRMRWTIARRPLKAWIATCKTRSMWSSRRWPGRRNRWSFPAPTPVARRLFRRLPTWRKRWRAVAPTWA